MTKHRKLHLLLAQINPMVGDLAGNFAKIRQIRAEAPEGTDLIVFPETVASGYPAEDLVLKPAFIDAIAAEIEQIRTEPGPALLLPAPWRVDQQIHNAALLIDDQRISAVVSKCNLPNYGVFDDYRVFTRGPLPAPVDFRGIRLGILICEDLWTAEVAGHLAAQGAEILISPNASPFADGKNDLRLRTVGARVAETGLPIVYVNQVGGQDDLVYDGASFILNETGRILHQSPAFEEHFQSVILERTEGGSDWLCEAGDIAPYPDRLAALYRTMMLGLHDYTVKNGFPGVILGLSGGIDSAITAAVAVDALGASRVRCVMLPSPYTSQDSLDDAAACAAALGITLDTVSIEPAMRAFDEMLFTHIAQGAPGVTYENIQSRSRGVTLMALSNASGYMLLSTGNKSELATGYATLYGDMCGGYNVLKDVYKTDVYRLSEWRNANKPAASYGPEGLVIPDRILTKAPTAELKPNQTDQDTLPPYEILDAILKGLIEDDRGIAEIAADGYDEALVRRIRTMLDRAEYKRRQSCPGPKLTARAFTRERRYPITNGFKE